MSPRASFVARWQSLRAAFRRDPLVPLGAGLRRDWRASLGVTMLVVGAAGFDAWVYSCGFVGCPPPRFFSLGASLTFS